MGNPTPGYWQCSLTCSDGSVKIGNGGTEDDAIIRATLSKQEHEKYLALPDIDKLKALISGEFSGYHQREATRILGKLVITLCDRFGSEPR